MAVGSGTSFQLARSCETLTVQEKPHSWKLTLKVGYPPPLIRPMDGKRTSRALGVYRTHGIHQR